MLQILVICALCSYGMFTLQRPGFLLDKLPNLWKKFPKGLHEPLFACGICVSSIWGALFFLYMVWVEYNVPESNWWAYWLPVALIGSVGLTSIMDRLVKASERHYEYKAPSQRQGEAKWEYLLPYEEVRRMLINQFVSDNITRGQFIIEVGGRSEKWEGSELYYYFDGNNMLTDKSADYLSRRIKEEGKNYCVVILGLCFQGDLRILKKLIASSAASIIEYCDDGISRQQIELITEGIKTRTLIPEFEINTCETTPGQCGDVTKRKVIILQP